jgi:hypothetical protein
MAEEFTEDDFEEEDTSNDDDQPKMVRGGNIMPLSQAMAKKPTQAAQATAAAVRPQQPQPPATRDAAAPVDKYTPYSIPTRVGVFDNELGKPILEDTDIMGVLLTLLTKVANDLEEIKGRL